eukprot:PhM_4_TR15094/c0_g1_i1/m.71817
MGACCSAENERQMERLQHELVDNDQSDILNGNKPVHFRIKVVSGNTIPPVRAHTVILEDNTFIVFGGVSSSQDLNGGNTVQGGVNDAGSVSSAHTGNGEPVSDTHSQRRQSSVNVFSNDTTRFWIGSQRWEGVKIRGLVPPARCAHTAVTYHGAMYILGTELYDSSDLFQLNLQSNHWRCVPASGEAPPAIAGHTAVVHQDTMFVFGGEVNMITTNQLYSYVFPHHKWMQHVATGEEFQPQSRRDHTATMVGDSMVVFGGFGRVDPVEETLVAFDTDSMQWEKPSQVGECPAARGGHIAANYRDYVIIHGGMGAGGVVLCDAHMYHLETRSWRRLGLGPKLCFHAAALFEDRIFLFGGNDGISNSAEANVIPLKHLVTQAAARPVVVGVVDDSESIKALDNALSHTGSMDGVNNLRKEVEPINTTRVTGENDEDDIYNDTPDRKSSSVVDEKDANAAPTTTGEGEGGANDDDDAETTALQGETSAEKKGDDAFETENTTAPEGNKAEGEEVAASVPEAESKDQDQEQGGNAVELQQGNSTPRNGGAAQSIEERPLVITSPEQDPLATTVGEVASIFSPAPTNLPGHDNARSDDRQFLSPTGAHDAEESKAAFELATAEEEAKQRAGEKEAENTAPAAADADDDWNPTWNAEDQAKDTTAADVPAVADADDKPQGTNDATTAAESNDDPAPIDFDFKAKPEAGYAGFGGTDMDESDWDPEDVKAKKEAMRAKEREQLEAAATGDAAKEPANELDWMSGAEPVEEKPAPTDEFPANAAAGEEPDLDFNDQAAPVDNSINNNDKKDDVDVAQEEPDFNFNAPDANEAKPEPETKEEDGFNFGAGDEAPAAGEEEAGFNFGGNEAAVAENDAAAEPDFEFVAGNEEKPTAGFDGFAAAGDNNDDGGFDFGGGNADAADFNFNAGDNADANNNNSNEPAGFDFVSPRFDDAAPTDTNNNADPADIAGFDFGGGGGGGGEDDGFGNFISPRFGDEPTADGKPQAPPAAAAATDDNPFGDFSAGGVTVRGGDGGDFDFGGGNDDDVPAFEF